MISIEEQPELICINPLSKCIKWRLLDNNYVTNAGTNAQVYVVFFDATAPFADGTEVVIGGKTFTVDNGILGFEGQRFFGASFPSGIRQALIDAVSACFDVSHILIDSAGATGVLFNWNNPEEVNGLVDGTTFGDFFTVSVNGTNPTYTENKVKAVLYCHDGDELKEVTKSTVQTKVINGQPQPIDFIFNSDIANYISNELPDFDSFSGIVPSQKKFSIGYSYMIKTDACQFVSSTETLSQPIIAYSGVIQEDDPAGAEPYCFDDLNDVEYKVLNQFFKKCVCPDTYQWLYISTQLNCIFRGIFNLEFKYGATIIIKDGDGNTVGTFNEDITDFGEDGTIYIGAGACNLRDKFSYAGESYTIQMYAIFRNIGTTTETTLPITEVMEFEVERCCNDVEIYWLEPNGAFSTMCLSHIDERSVKTEGEKICIAKPCGLSYTQSLKRAKYSSFNKKSTRMHKAILEKEYTRSNEEALALFLASDEYYIKTKDRRGNDIQRKILLEYGSSSLYKKGELLELSISFQFAEQIKTQSNYA